jgi:DNA segregation ATPase FtsK/SpoIIIE, S-DNA-T family
VTRSPGARIRSLRRGTTGPEAVDITDGAAGAVPTDGAEGALWFSTGCGRPRSSVLVGDPDAWQARWSLFASLRSRCRIVFDGCAVTDVRALLQTRVLPPLIADSRQVWVREPDGALSRARLTLENEN